MYRRGEVESIPDRNNNREHVKFQAIDGGMKTNTTSLGFEVRTKPEKPPDGLCVAYASGNAPAESTARRTYFFGSQCLLRRLSSIRIIWARLTNPRIVAFYFLTVSYQTGLQQLSPRRCEA